NKVLPEAQGQVARMIQEAEGYRARVVGAAQGDTARFTSVEQEYTKAPDVTRDRLYLTTMQDILTNSSKILIDSQGGNNMLYLPLDQIMRQAASEGRSFSATVEGQAAAGAASSTNTQTQTPPADT